MTQWIVIALVLAGTGALLHKCIRIHKMLFLLREELSAVKVALRAHDTARDVAYVYDQLQAYLDLTRLLSPVAPLPRLRGWAASPDFLLLICEHALRHKPNVILECSSGASTIALARCCQLSGTGHVYSLEHAPAFAAKTRENLAAHGLSEWASVIDAPLRDYAEADNAPWYSLSALPALASGCGLLVIDGPPAETAALARYPALGLLSPRLARGCTIFLDDYGRNAEQQIVQRWLAETPGLALESIETEKGCARLACP